MFQLISETHLMPTTNRHLMTAIKLKRTVRKNALKGRNWPLGHLRRPIYGNIDHSYHYRNPGTDSFISLIPLFAQLKNYPINKTCFGL